MAVEAAEDDDDSDPLSAAGEVSSVAREGDWLMWLVTLVEENVVKECRHGNTHSVSFCCLHLFLSRYFQPFWSPFQRNVILLSCG